MAPLGGKRAFVGHSPRMNWMRALLLTVVIIVGFLLLVAYCAPFQFGDR